MTTRKSIRTPNGVYHIFTDVIQDGIHLASVLYYVKYKENPSDITDFGTMDFKLHTEHAIKADDAINALVRWCEGEFGQPCTVQD